MTTTALTDIQRVAREAAEESARAQGLPARVTDPIVIERVAVIVRAARERDAA